MHARLRSTSVAKKNRHIQESQVGTSSLVFMGSSDVKSAVNPNRDCFKLYCQGLTHDEAYNVIRALVDQTKPTNASALACSLHSELLVLSWPGISIDIFVCGYHPRRTIDVTTVTVTVTLDARPVSGSARESPASRSGYAHTQNGIYV